jgi:hypothetical protein
MGGENRFLCPRNVPLPPIDFWVQRIRNLYLYIAFCWSAVGQRKTISEDIGDLEGLLR